MLGVQTKNSDSTLREWRRKVLKGIPVRDSRGRVGYMSKECEEELIKKVAEDKHPPLMSEVNNIIKKEAETQKNLFKAKSNEKISGSYLLKKKKKLGIYETNAEQTTFARIAAEEDSRNAMAMAAAVATIVPDIHPSLIMNADATQFNVGGHDEGKVKVAAVRGRPRQQYQVPPVSGRKLAYFIKYYLLIDAEGTRGDPINIIADPCMGPDDFDHYTLKELASSTSRHDTAYIVFMQSRVPNKEFYRWFNETILIPFVEDQREKIPDYDCSKVGFFTLDGENNQIGVYEEIPEIGKIEAAEVITAKPPSSTTHLTQPCDVGNSFRGSKQELKFLDDEEFANHALLPKLDKIFKTQRFKIHDQSQRCQRKRKNPKNVC
jgi:hypothetical protein